jgi:sugar phosphate isomerase/epimerase
MKLGMMNDPALDAVDEARWAAGHKFDFLDLTMEGPTAAKEQLEVPALRKVLDDTGLGIVGHNAWYLPFGSPIKEVRAGAVAAVEATFEPFAQLGAKLVNVHVDKGIGAFAYDDTVRWNAECFADLAERAKPYGITVMIENVVNNLNNAKAMRVMLDAHPDLRFHLDIAHANVRGERTKEYLKAHAAKLVHVHVSDNKRTSDDHLPLGVGDIHWPEQLGMLKDTGYDGTITLEIFTPERDFLLDSAQRVRRIWEQV